MKVKETQVKQTNTATKKNTLNKISRENFIKQWKIKISVF